MDWRSFWSRFAPEVAAGTALLVISGVAHAVGVAITWRDVMWALVAVAAALVALILLRAYRAEQRHRQAARHRLDAIIRKLCEHEESIGKLEAAAMAEAAYAAVRAGWKVARADPAWGGPPWFQFISPDGSTHSIVAVEPTNELLAHLGEHDPELKAAAGNGNGVGDFSSADLVRKRIDSSSF